MPQQYDGSIIIINEEVFMLSEKRPYSKPQIKQVKLLIEDAILVLCRRNTDQKNRRCSAAACGNRGTNAS
jgi:hypothetical protein